MRKLALLVATFTVLIGVLGFFDGAKGDSAAASVATCVPNALTPVVGHGNGIGVGETAGCGRDAYHYTLQLVTASGFVLSQRQGNVFGNQRGSTNPAFCHNHSVRSVLSIVVHGESKTSSSRLIDC